jgi:regulator of protease activity HflC (stomatin/prohibitin superfamily)
MKRFLTAIFAVLGLVIMAGCSSVNTQADEQALHYKGGSLSSASFSNCVGSSTRNFDGPGDDHYVYPKGQRTYAFGDSNADTGPISVVSNDNVTMQVSGVATFNLTSNCAQLRKFHEQIASKFNADMVGGQPKEGWNRLLGQYMKQPLEKALDAASKQYGYRDLYTNPDVKEQWENQVSTLAKRYMLEQTGENYFQNISLTIQAPEPPENIKEALEAEQEAVAQNDAQKQRNETARTQYDSFTDCKKVLSEDNCVLLNLAREGHVPIVPVPQGGGINLNAQ